MKMLRYIQDTLGIGCSLVLCLVLVVATRIFLRVRHQPPGPWGFPWLGIVPYLAAVEYIGGMPRYEILANLAARYGSVFSMTVFGRSVVILSDPEVVKEAFSRQEFNDRPEIRVEHIPTGTGVALACGERWKQQRKFTIRVLEKHVCQKKITEEVGNLMKALAKATGKPFNPKYHLRICVSNNITELLFSTKHNYNDLDYKKYLDMISEITDLMGSSGAAHSIPLICRLPIPSRIRLSKLLVSEFDGIRNIIKTHRDNLKRQNPRDYVDEYLDEILDQKERGAVSEVNDQNLPETLVQLFSAGTENTSTTLRWAILYLIANPHVQIRVQDELDRVVGRNRLPEFSDEPSLIYTRATLLEVHRIATVTPLGVAHVSSSKDVTLRGWTIPTNSVVFPNVWGVHRDPKIWKDPDVFNPERFIGERKIVKEDYLIPFGVGNRVCPGRNLARMEIFIIFTHLMHRFSFRKVSGSTISFRGRGSFARVPEDYMVQVSERT